MNTWDEINTICANLDLAIAKARAHTSESWDHADIAAYREELDALKAARKILSDYKSFRAKFERLQRGT